MVALVRRDEAKQILMVGETSFGDLLKAFPQLRVRKGLYNREKLKDLFVCINQHGGIKPLLKRVAAKK